MECIFRTYFSHVWTNKSLNLDDFFTEKFSTITFDKPDCHKMKSRIIKRFEKFRLKIKSRKMKKIGKYFSSKSMAMHYDIK